MAIKIICECGTKFSVGDELAGTKVTCPACQKVLNLSQAKPERLAAHERQGFEASPPKAKPVAEDLWKTELQSVRASKVRAGVSCYFVGFLVIFFSACWAACAPTLYQGDFAKLFRDMRVIGYLSVLTEVCITIGFGVCLTAPLALRGRNFLFVAVLGGFLELLITAATLWNPLMGLRVGSWLPVCLLLLTHTAFFLFLRSLGEFVGRAEITSRATCVLVLLGINSVIWLGAFRMRPPTLFMFGHSVELLLALLLAVVIVALIGLFSVIRLLSKCRELLRIVDRAADQPVARGLSRTDVWTLAIGGGLVTLSLWGWIALRPLTPARVALPSNIAVPTRRSLPSSTPIPAVAPQPPKVEKTPGKKLLNLTGHKGIVWNVAFNSDWSRLATASFDKTIKIWDAATAQEVRTLTSHTDVVRRVVFSPDGQQLASVSNDKSVKLWDVASGQELRTLTGHSAAVVGVAFSPDGQRLATTSDDKTVKLWEVATGRDLRTLTGHTQAINVVAFSPDGTRLASADLVVKVWDALSGQELLTLKGHTGFVMGLAFRPDGQQLATASLDSTIRLWDIASGQGTHTLKGHHNIVNSVVYRPDGKRLISIGSDQKLKEWDSASGELRQTTRSKGTMGSLALSADGQQLAAAGMMGAVEIWEQPTEPPATAHTGHTGTVSSVAFSPDGQWIASGSSDQTIRLWNAESGQNAHLLRGHAGGVVCVGYRSDGLTLVSVSNSVAEVKEWDVRSGQETSTSPVNISGIIAMNSEGTALASANYDYSIHRWKLDRVQEAAPLKGHAGFLSSVAFSDDGLWLVSAGMVLGKPGAPDYFTKPGEIRVWNISTGQESRLLGGQTAQAGVAISPDGKRLASSHRDAAVLRDGAVYQGSILKFWDAQSGQELHAHKSAVVATRVLRFSRDGKRLAFASPQSGDITLFDSTTGQELLTLKGHTQLVNGLAFSPDDTRLSTASNDETVRIWDTTTGRELLVLGVPVP